MQTLTKLQMSCWLPQQLQLQIVYRLNNLIHHLLSQASLMPMLSLPLPQQLGNQ
jgi:hypothetical protein